MRYPPPPARAGLENDLTPFVEEEHFDLGLFVADVLADRAPVARVYR
ncbi:hypothetical protein ACIRVF_32270 [Kitasatospora sp. NPDC101157]